MSDFMSTEKSIFTFDSLDPVDIVLSTDNRFEDAMVMASTVEEAVTAVEEAGYILEGREDYDMDSGTVTEDTFDPANPVDVVLSEGEECSDDDEESDEDDIEDDDDDILYDDNGEIIDEVLDASTGGPGTMDDDDDNDMIDAVAAGNVDANGNIEVEEGYTDYSYNEFIAESDCTSDAAVVSDDDDDEEAVNEVEESAVDPFGDFMF